MAQKPPSPLHDPPAQAAVVDEVAEEPETDRYTCTCRDPDAKLDSTGIQCDQCHSWFHSECVNVWDIAFLDQSAVTSSGGLVQVTLRVT